MGQILRLSRGQTKPYNSVPRIDWSHPLAQGLSTYCYDFGGCIIDLVNGGLNTAVGCSGLQSSQSGPGLKIPLTGYIFMPPISPNLINGLGGGSTAFSAAMGTLFTGHTDLPNVGGGNDCACATVQDAGNSEATAFGFNTLKGPPDQVAGVYANVGITIFNQTITIGAYQSWAVAAVPSGANQYANGVLDTTHSGNPFSSAVVNPQIMYNTASINSGQTFGNGVNGFIFYFAMWFRTITATEALQLHQDPYQFLIYPEDEVKEILVGTKPAAWFLGAFDHPQFPTVNISY